MKTKTFILMIICIFVGFVLGMYFGSPLVHSVNRKNWETKGIFPDLSSFTKNNKPASESQSAKEAIKALKKIEAKTQVGVSYEDYMKALGDARFEVNMFLESPEAVKMPQLSKSLRKVMIYHNYAKYFYDMWLNNHKCRKSTEEWIKQAMVIYPELSEAVWKQEGDRCYPGYMSIEMAISIFWRKASKELALQR